MDNYNQIIVSQSQTCIGETSTGFCSDWENITDITINTLDLIVLIFVFSVPFFLFRFFKRK